MVIDYNDIKTQNNEIPNLINEIEAYKIEIESLKHIKNRIEAAELIEIEGKKALEELNIIKTDISSQVQKEIEVELATLATMRTEKAALQESYQNALDENREILINLKKSDAMKVVLENNVRELQGIYMRSSNKYDVIYM
jgi:hypothetical protein